VQGNTLSAGSMRLLLITSRQAPLVQVLMCNADAPHRRPDKPDIRGEIQCISKVGKPTLTALPCSSCRMREVCYWAILSNLEPRRRLILPRAPLGSI
jgi:hypothetical protein